MLWWRNIYVWNMCTPIQPDCVRSQRSRQVPTISDACQSGGAGIYHVASRFSTAWELVAGIKPGYHFQVLCSRNLNATEKFFDLNPCCSLFSDVFLLLRVSNVVCTIPLPSLMSNDSCLNHVWCSLNFHARNYNNCCSLTRSAVFLFFGERSKQISSEFVVKQTEAVFVRNSCYEVCFQSCSMSAFNEVNQRIVC